MTYRGLFTDHEYADVREFFRDAQPTPLHRVGDVLVKDESQRFGLGAFKIAGVSYAVARLNIPADATLVCASAGNHGRAVAHVGRAKGLRVRVYMSATTPAEAQARIRAEEAEVVVVEGTYDDAVARARDDGGFVISDTAWRGYEKIPRLIMAGYTQIMHEAEAQWGESRPDAVFVQAGVGALAGAVVSWFCHRYGAERPSITCVKAGRRPTIMSGLDCKEPSSLAVPILAQGCDSFVTVDDDAARHAMERLAAGGVSAGPSGAAGYAGYLKSPSRGIAFVINTELPVSARA